MFGIDFSEILVIFGHSARGAGAREAAPARGHDRPLGRTCTGDGAAIPRAARTGSRDFQAPQRSARAGAAAGGASARAIARAHRQRRHRRRHQRPTPSPRHPSLRNPMSEDNEALPEGTLISHLLELRSRLLRAMIAVLIAFLPCAYYSNQIFDWLATPLVAKLPPGQKLIATTVTATFTAPLKLALVTGLLIAMPYVLYQIWAFVAPGLYRKEKRFAMPLLVSAIAAVLRRGRVLVPVRVSAGVPFLHRHDAAQRAAHGRYHQLPAVRAHAVRRLRRGLRDAGRGGAAGADQPGDACRSCARCAATC